MSISEICQQKKLPMAEKKLAQLLSLTYHFHLGYFQV